MLSVAHAAFYGIGAYATTLLLKMLGLNFFFALPLAVVITMLVALLIGVVLSKFKTDYYALASLGFGVIVYVVFQNWLQVTRGPFGIPGIPRPDMFGFTFVENVAFLLLALVVLACVYALARFMVRSSFGRILTAIREDETAISVFGYRTTSYKLIIFTIAAGMAAIAGGLYASYITFIAPSAFSVNESIFILAIVILGGAGSLRGPLMGAVVLVLLPELLRFVGLPSDIAAQMRQLLYGVILVLLMLYRPQGLVGTYKL
ncbi:branched-chain amino acid ABC transporter permease [Candidatus Uhrbacteria bacterium RIFCSPLOWO2_01_FULL_53_9]|uniref:Branched-chain amino acid ABC transporter permease n=3 Tax=Candidatus Uhriibacteriota TaxID=1752732 RepID=A0A1F7UYK9_9BACT|nr:MAG: branched-chain amino acid ABC transporter permease [Candidatus Uhrbacteria bacterium RIFCSPHIGHO2_02_FULL_53_13]OGL83343.1 MAG: branched-chain amino acid ABC transporter permease [Candidatus Uhrbacteria bacterium RIFCSPLOWO2_01_FULL_53_9]OGL90474.1 MAG: branched-chain amino acid ABC transporter permease [Candidatus Uhrbacteria bacterium RIFCSPLOWO2_02_FULL_53_10]